MAAQSPPPLGDVSCRATGHTIQQFQRMGLPTAHLTRGLAYTLDDLQSHAASISWDEYLVFVRNSQSDLPTDQLVQLCTAYQGSSYLRPLLSAAGLWFHPAKYFQWVADPKSGALIQLYRCVKTSFTHASEREVMIEEVIEPGFALPPDIFWESQAIAFGALTTYFGLAPSIVTWEPVVRGAVFRVRLPRRRPVRFVLSWLASWFRRDTADDVRSALSHGHERSLRLEREIAERKRAEAALRESEERMRRITDAVPGIVYRFVLTPDGSRTFSYVSAGVGEITGWSAAEVVANPMMMLSAVHPDDVPALREGGRVAARDRTSWTHEFRLTARDGSLRWVRGCAIPEPDDGSRPQVWNGILIDVTAEKQADANLRARDALLQKLSEQVPGFIYQYQQWPDGRSRFPDASEGIRDIYEVTPEDVHVSAEAVFGRVHPDDLDAVVESIRQSMETLEPWRCEYRVRLPQRGVRWLDGHAVPERLPDGSTIWHGYIRDVTDRKSAERLVWESEERLSFALAAADIGDWDMDLRTNIARRSLRHDQCFGHTEPVAEWGYDTFLAHVQPIDRDRVDATYRTALAGDGDYDVEFRVAWPDGSLHWLWSKGHFYSDENGQPYRVAGIQVDITERKRAEFALRESEERFRLAVEATGAGVWDHRLDNSEIDFSEQLKRIYGLPPAAVVTRERLVELIHPDDRDAFGRVLAAAAAPDHDGNYVLEHRVVRPDGSIVWVVAHGRSFFDGSPGDRKLVRSVGIVRDVSAQKRADEALRASEERYRLLFEANPHPMWVYDLETLRFLAVNEAAICHYGYTRGEFLAMTIKDIRPVEDVPRLLANVSNLDTGLDLAGIWRHCKKDGSVIDVDISSHMLTFDGRAAEVVLANDVTSQKQAERALLESEERFRLALAAGRMGTFDWDIMTDRIVWSDTHYDLFGYPPGDRFSVEFRHFADRLHPDDRPAIERAIHDAKETHSSYTNESRIVLPDGTVRWVLGSGEFRYAPDGRPIRMLGTAIDITERKRAEAALRESEERLRLALAAGRMGTFDWDIPSNAILWSHTHYELFGYPKGGFPVQYRHFAEPIHPEDRGRVERVLREAMENRTRYQCEFRILLGDGLIRWVAGIGDFQYAPDGRPVRMIGTVADVTERNLAQTALRESELRYRTLIETSSDGIFLLDLTGRILSANPAAVRQHGYSMEELLSMRMQDIDLPDDAADLPDRMRRLRAGESLTFEVFHRRKDGTIFPVEVVASAVEIGGEWLVLAFDRDITERKRAEGVLRFQHALLRAQTEASPDGILVVDPANHILSNNHRFLEVWGVPAELVAAGDDTQVLAWARGRAADPGAFGARVASIYADPDTPSHDEVALADGRTLDRYSRPVRGADGELFGLVWYFRDITERKRAESELRESVERLRLALSAATAVAFVWDIVTDSVVRYFSTEPAFPANPDAPEPVAAVVARVHPDDRPRFKAGIAACLADGSEYRNLYRVVRPDGTARWLEEWGTLGLNRDGSPARLTGISIDVTERREAEAALQLAERRQRLALDAGRMGTWDWEIGSERLVWDAREQTLFGFAPGEFDGRLGTFLDRVHPDDLDGVRQVLADASVGKDFDGEFRIQLPSGEVRWVHGSGVTVPKSEHSPPRLVGINYDISERKRAEETVRQILEGISPRTGREFFRVLVDYLCKVCEVTFAFVGTIDPQHPDLVRTIAVSHRGQVADNFTYDLRGTPCEKVVGHTFCSFPTGVQQSFPDDTMLVDMGIDGYLGTPLWSSGGLPLGLIVLLHDRPVPHPKQAEVVLKVVAARAGAELERQQADAALRESEERLRIFVENAPAGVAMLDRNVRYLSYSRRWITDYGLGDQNLVGRSHYEVFPEVTDRWKEIHRRCLTGVSERCEQDRFERADGSVDYLRWEIQPWTDATGAVGGLVFFTELITDQVKAGDQVRASLREKEAMLKEIHHRVKNNLQVISSLLSLQAARVTHPAATDVLAESQNRVRAMALVHETLYRSDDLARVDMSRYLGELCGYLFRSYGVDSARIRIEVNVEPVTISLDKTIPCGLIVNEIVSNSLKYAFPGTRSGTVTVEASMRPDGHLTLTLADDGVGLPAEVVVDRTPSLGLQLVKILTEQIGGRLTVERFPGTRFVISFAP